MTAVPANPRISELRLLFRHLAEFRATFEATGLDVITTPYGNTWSLWDLEYLYEVASERLSLQQRRAISLCLVHGVREADAAEMMGVSRTNPVMMYATLGLHLLLEMIDHGEIERFNRPVIEQPEEQLRAAQLRIENLAVEIEAKIFKIRDCWLYPNRTPGPPRMLISDPSRTVGCRQISPLAVLYRVQVGPIPPGFYPDHSTRVRRVSVACVNPHHAELKITPERQAEIQTMAERYLRMRQGAAA